MTDRRGQQERRSGKERRKHRRKKTCISGNLINPENENSASCLINDADANGCRLYSSNLHEFPNTILLQPDGMKSPIKGEVVWRSHNMAGVRFDYSG